MLIWRRSKLNWIIIAGSWIDKIFGWSIIDRSLTIGLFSIYIFLLTKLNLIHIALNLFSFFIFLSIMITKIIYNLRLYFLLLLLIDLVKCHPHNFLQLLNFLIHLQIHYISCIGIYFFNFFFNFSYLFILFVFLYLLLLSSLF